MKARIISGALVLLIVVAVSMWAKPLRGQESHGRWQYCSVGLGFSRSISEISYFAVDGVRTEPVQGKDNWDGFRRAMAKLGADGWEIVGVVGENPIAYFKRPVQ